MVHNSTDMDFFHLKYEKTTLEIRQEWQNSYFGKWSLFTFPMQLTKQV